MSQIMQYFLEECGIDLSKAEYISAWTFRHAPNGNDLYTPQCDKLGYILRFAEREGIELTRNEWLMLSMGEAREILNLLAGNGDIKGDKAKEKAKSILLGHLALQRSRCK